MHTSELRAVGESLAKALHEKAAPFFQDSHGSSITALRASNRLLRSVRLIKIHVQASLEPKKLLR